MPSYDADPFKYLRDRAMHVVGYNNVLSAPKYWKQNTAAGYLLDLIKKEPVGVAIDFVAMEMLLRGGSSPFYGDPNSGLTYTSPSPKRIVDRHGTYQADTTLRCDHDFLTLDTSATSLNTLGVGSGALVRKTLTTTGTVTYAVGDDVVASDAADISKWMAGTVVSYNAGTLVVDFRAASGYFACSSWKTIVARGLRVEEQSTNLVRNSAATGGSAPSTPPTNWVFGGISGISYSFSTVTENGVECIDLRMQGTAGATTSGRIQFEGSTVNAAAVAQIWTGSFFAKIVANPGVNLPTIQSEIREFTSGVAGSIDPVTRTLTSVLTRYQQTTTLLNAGTTSVQNPIRLGVTNGVAYDFTIRIGWPQLEQLGLASSPIRTTSAAVTRAADNISLALAGGAAGTLFGSYRRLTFDVASSSPRVFNLGDATDNNQVRVAASSTGPTLAVLDAAVATVNSTPAGFSDAAGGVDLNFAGGYALNNSRSVTKGVLSTLDTTCTIPATSIAHVGSNRGTNGFLNGHIKTLGYVPRRMIDTDLQLRAPA